MFAAMNRSAVVVVVFPVTGLELFRAVQVEVLL